MRIRNRWLAVVMICFSAFALLVGGLVWSASQRRGVEPRRLDGVRVRIEPDVAPLTILHFWATWCVPCRAELIDFQKFASANSREFQLVPIAMEEDAVGVARFLQQNNVRMDSLFDPGGQYAARFGIEELPTTVVLNRKGLIVGLYVGPLDWASPSVLQKLRELAQK